MENIKANSTMSQEGEESGETISHGGLELEPPGRGTIFENPPDGGLRAWLIVLTCAFINALLSIMQTMIRVSLLDSKMSSATGMDDETQQEVSSQLEELVDIYAPVAAFVMIFFGYKKTVCIGAGVVMTTVVFISYLGDDDTEGFIKFLLYGPTAIGMSFIKLGALIPVLEYFTTKRMKALFLSRLGTYVGRIIFAFVLILGPTKNIWRRYLRGCSALCVCIGLLGLTLPELRITMKENRSVTFIQKTVGLGNKDLLKSLLFWLTCAVYFFYHWGIDTPQGEIIAMLTRLDFGGSIAKLLFYVLSQPIGQALGMFIAWIVRKVVHGEKNRPDDDHAHKDSRLTHIFGLLVATAFTMSIGCFVAPEAVNFEYFFTFSLLFATFFGMNEGFRDYVVPEEFGRDNVRIVEGLILMCVGLGGLITNEITLKIDDWKRGFRYGGGMLLLSGSVTTIVLALKQSKALDEIQSKINGNSVVPLRADGNRTNVPGTQQTGPSTLTHNTVNKQPSVGPITNTSRQQTVPSTFNGSFQPYRQSNVPTSSQNSGVQPYRQSTQGYANQNGGFHPPQQTIGVQHISVYDM